MIQDWEINCMVRAHLVKWWIDIKRVDIQTVDGVVYIKGSLYFRSTAKIEEEERPQAVGQLEKEIKRMPGVKDLFMELTNWVKMEDRWREREMAL